MGTARIKATIGARGRGVLESAGGVYTTARVVDVGVGVAVSITTAVVVLTCCGWGVGDEAVGRVGAVTGAATDGVVGAVEVG